MDTLEDIGQLARLHGPVHLAIGVFDGVHLGHQAVIQTALRQPHGSPVVVTFDPHPARVLRPDRAPLLLTSTRHKLLLLERLGVPNVLVLPFNAALAATEAADFVTRLQHACHPLGSITVGHDWTFGHRARGNVALLQSLGITVHAVPPVIIDGSPASSTTVRHSLATGNLAHATRLLGRPPTTLGTVIQGRQLGRQLGFPTANITPDTEQLPPNGVYAVRATLDNHTHHAVANIGLRPTLHSPSPQRLLEVHLLDFHQSIYGAELEIEWVARLRPEQQFPSLDALAAQITLDVATAKSTLSRSQS